MGSNEKEYAQISQSIHDPIISAFLNSKFSRARELGVTLTFDLIGELQQITDSSVTHRLITILGNLIDNGLDAVQFLEDKKIAVQLNITKNDLIIQVKDNGNGISQEDSQKIFTKGYSTKGDNRGIGLYLVLASVNELNGHIELDQKVGLGTCFRIYLPLKKLY
ncbi:ATP-binding protein [Orbus mooreae]|uniref:ATP-binding protein n=1 Tax=Orbus mooreae TaxID=3074107 RepID=UPI00370DC2E7